MQRFNSYFMAALFAATALLFTACQKEQPQTVENTTVQPAASGFRSTVEPCTAFDEADFLINPNDAADQNVNYALYYLTYAYRQVNAQQPAAIAALKTAVQNSISYEVDLYAFANNQPTITATINSAVAAIAEQSTINFNYKTFLNPKLVHTQIQYKPMVVVPNAATADFGLPIYWAVAAQIDENIHPSKEDHIPVFYLDENGNCTFTTLGEAEAMALENPLFIIANGSLDAPYNQPRTQPTIITEENQEMTAPRNPNENTGHQNSHNRVIVPTYHRELVSVNYAFEGSGDLEFTTIAVVMAEGTTFINEARIFLSERIRRANVGSPIQRWLANIHPALFMREFASGGYNPNANGDCEIFMATYERDWGTSAKSLGSYCYDGNNRQRVTGERVYDHE